MGEVLGLGLSHYPGLCLTDEDMSFVLSLMLENPDLPAAERDPASWPAEMQREWREGTAAAAEHRAALVANLDRLRETVDAFAPEVLVIWGDDQYENFKEDVIPPYTVCAYDDMEIAPWADPAESSAMIGRRNVWDEGPDTRFIVRGRPDIARHLVTELLGRGIDAAYAYRPLHHDGLGHAFVNALLFLDYHRKGIDYPVIGFPLNCYGRRVISWRGLLSRPGVELDPPSPPPRRFMELGAATARIFLESPWRVALVASSSWSHAFLCEKFYKLRPDTESDRRLYRALERSDYAPWRSTSLEAVEDAGQQEMLNWFALMGAMEALGATLDWSEWVGSYVFNSNKVFAAYKPVQA